MIIPLISTFWKCIITELTIFFQYVALPMLPKFINKFVNLTYLKLSYHPIHVSLLLKNIDRLINLDELSLNDNQLKTLPESIGNLSHLTSLRIHENQLSNLPTKIGNLSNLECLSLDDNQLTVLPDEIGNLSNLVGLYLRNNRLTNLPNSLSNLSNLTELYLPGNQLANLPDSIESLSNLTHLDLERNQLVCLPDRIGELSKLTYLNLNHNQLTSLPESISNLSNLTELYLDGNPLTDLSILQIFPNLKHIKNIYALGVYLPRRYWTKLSEWNPEWLLDEENAEIRQRLITQIGYEKTCKILNTITLDIWREYTLIEIANLESFDSPEATLRNRESIVLLKMTCPSTGHIHILRVPPEMVSAEEAIAWVNHGIHPDKFAVQT